MKYRILGTLEVCLSSKPIAIAGPQQRALLAMLLLKPGQVVSSWDLIDELWPNRASSPVRRNTLHAQVARLRNTLTAGTNHRTSVALYSKSAGYVLEVDLDDLDVAHFQRLRRRGASLTKEEPIRAIDAYRQALSLWRGSALQDAQIGKRCTATAASFDEARLYVQEELARLCIKHDDPNRVVDDLRELVYLYPTRETLLAVLMSAMHACGRRTEAIQVYTEARYRFNDQFGMEPGEAMRSVYLKVIKED